MRKHSDLRSLSLAYYWGWIPRGKYLALRQEFLQSITQDKQPRPIKPKELAPPREKPILTDTSSDNILSQNKAATITGAVIVLVILALIFYFIPSNKDAESTNQQPATAKKTSSLPDPTQTASTPESRFTEFLSATLIRKSDWSPDALNILKFKWQGLSQEQQSVIRGSKTFIEFGRMLIRKILEERSLNNIVPSDKELTLMTAARNMGLLELLPAEEKQGSL